MSAFEQAGYGARAVGFGERPAVLVVDLQRAFTDPAFELGRFEAVGRAVENTATLLDAARAGGVPVAKCYIAYESERDVPRWKIDALYRDFFAGDAGTGIDPRLHDPDHDFTFPKQAPSIFFNTPLVPYLNKHGVDTVLVTGCTTSGCVRASVVDSFSWGYRTIVVSDCCGDGSEATHQANLDDVRRRYADVYTLDEALARLREQGGD